MRPLFSRSPAGRAAETACQKREFGRPLAPVPFLVPSLAHSQRPTMTRSPLAGFLALSLTLSFGCARIFDPAGYAFEQAQIVDQAGNYDEAIAQYHDVATKYPDDEAANKATRAATAAAGKATDAMIAGGRFADAAAYAKAFGVQFPGAPDESVKAGVFHAIQKAGVDSLGAVDPSDIPKSLREGAGQKAAAQIDQAAAAARSTDSMGLALEGHARLAQTLAFLKLKDGGASTAALVWVTTDGAQTSDGLLLGSLDWACQHKLEFPDWATCSALPIDVSRLEDLPLLQAGKSACEHVSLVAVACPTDAATADAAIMVHVNKPGMEATSSRVDALIAAEAAALAKKQIADAAVLTRAVASAGQSWCSAKATWDGQQREMAILAVENRIGAALRMEPGVTALQERADERQKDFEAMQDTIKGATWPADLTAPIQATYDKWEEKCSE